MHIAYVVHITEVLLLTVSLSIRYHVHTLVGSVGTPSKTNNSLTLMCARGLNQLLEKVVGCLPELMIVTDFLIGFTQISDDVSGMLCHIMDEAMLASRKLTLNCTLKLFLLAEFIHEFSRRLSAS